MGLGPIVAIVAAVLQFIIFLFVIVATPLDQIRSKYESIYGYRTCYSMWGIKRCGNHKANPGGAQYKGFPCKNIRNTMNAAAAFAIFSIFLTLVAAVLCIFLICKCIGGGMIPAIVGIIAFCTILVSWACVAGAYHYGGCKYTFLGVEYKVAKISKSNYKLYGGFGLLVTAWILQLINVVLLFLA